MISKKSSISVKTSVAALITTIPYMPETMAVMTIDSPVIPKCAIDCRIPLLLPFATHKYSLSDTKYSTTSVDHSYYFCPFLLFPFFYFFEFSFFLFFIILKTEMQ